MRHVTLLAPLTALALAIAAAPATAAVETRGWRIASISGEVEANLAVASPLSCQSPAVQQERPSDERQNLRSQYRASFKLKEVRGGEYTPDLKRSPVYRGPVAIGGPVGVRLDVRRSASETDRVLTGETSTNPDTNEETYACATREEPCTAQSRQLLSVRLRVEPAGRGRSQRTRIWWPLEASRFLASCTKDQSPLLEAVPELDMSSRHAPARLSGRRGTARIDRTVPIDTGHAKGTVRYRATLRLRRVIVRCGTTRARYVCRDRPG